MLLGTQVATDETAHGARGEHSRLPAIDVIVPFRNEVRLLSEKIADLRRLDYPATGLHFLLVDGQSADGSRDLAEELIAGDPRFTLLRAPRAGKTVQINLALTHCTADWVLVTDVDSSLPELALHDLTAAIDGDVRVAAAGVLHQPARTLRLDRLHWQFWNRSRQYERHSGSTSAVLGPCYMFRRDWLACLPDDVVADDMYVSFAALADGRRIALADCLVVERRAPSGLGAMLFHKVRKGRALLREVVRFLPAAAKMPAPMRGLFLRRSAAALVAPPLILGTVIVSLIAAPRAFAGVWGFALFCCFVPLERLLPGRLGQRFIKFWALAGLAVLLSCVLCAAILSLPFAPPRASFSRWRQEET